MSRSPGGTRDLVENDPILPADHDADEPDDLFDEPRRPRRRRVAVIALVVAVALGLAATSLFWLILSPGGGAASFAPSRIGDCLSADAGGTTYRQADCRDVSAQYQVMALAQDRGGCVDVAGVSRAYLERSGYLCIGAKGVDPATSLNGIGTGDCVATDTGRPLRSACRPDTLPVLAVVGDVSKSAGESSEGLLDSCRAAGAADVAQTYAWGLDQSDGSASATWDRLLCLGVAGS